MVSGDWIRSAAMWLRLTTLVFKTTTPVTTFAVSRPTDRFLIAILLFVFCSPILWSHSRAPPWMVGSQGEEVAGKRGEETNKNKNSPPKWQQFCRMIFHFNWRPMLPNFRRFLPLCFLNPFTPARLILELDKKARFDAKIILTCRNPTWKSQLKKTHNWFRVDLSKRVGRLALIWGPKSQLNWITGTRFPFLGPV